MTFSLLVIGPEDHPLEGLVPWLAPRLPSIKVHSLTSDWLLQRLLGLGLIAACYPNGMSLRVTDSRLSTGMSDLILFQVQAAVCRKHSPRVGNLAGLTVVKCDTAVTWKLAQPKFVRVQAV